MAAGDFWGEVQATTVRTPLAILREQAAMLGPKTNYLLEARVDTNVDEDRRFIHRFNLVVPALDNYTYQLFSIVHGVDLYPVKDWAQIHVLDDEAEFTEWLRQRPSSPETRKILSNLIAQAQS
jgi:hypothetical protein